MPTTDLLTFNKIATDRLSRLMTKKEKVAFLTGLSLGARMLGDEERMAVCKNYASLYDIQLTELMDDKEPARKSASPRETRARPPKLSLNPDLLARMAALKQS